MPPPAATPRAARPVTVQAVALPHAYRLLNTGATVLVASAHGARHNLMAAAWNMPLDFDPPKVAVVIDKATYTRELIEASGEFVLGVPPRALAALTVAAGHRSGRDAPGQDKPAALGLGGFAGSHVAAPLPLGCVGWLECRVLPEPRLQQAHDLFLAEVLAAWADERVFTAGRYRPLDQIPPELRTLHHLGAGQFVVPGEQIQA